MARQTLEQKRAQDAWEKSAEYKIEHVKLAKSLPALIMNSGLMQTMAFMHGKGNAHEQVAKHLREWLHRQCGTPTDFKEHMDALFNASPQCFQSINAEAFAWLKWLRQMAAARTRKGEQ